MIATRRSFSVGDAGASSVARFSTTHTNLKDTISYFGLAAEDALLIGWVCNLAPGG